MVKEQRLSNKIVRRSFAKIDEALGMPNLIDVQKKSYNWFIEEGLKEVLHEVSPIYDHSENLCIEFVDFAIDPTPKYPVEECKDRDVNYAAPLRVTVRLKNFTTGEVAEKSIFMGDFPLMTDNGTFIINGAERVIVSQIVRSPGAYYSSVMDKSGKKLYSATVIPYRGAWLEYETDVNDVFYVHIDKTRKVPVTVLIRALGCGSDDEIRAMFGDSTRVNATISKDGMNAAAAANKTSPTEEALKEIYTKIRPVSRRQWKVRSRC